MDREGEFIQVIKENEGVIFKITTIYTDNREDQQDLYQDIVYQLWKSFESFRGEAKFSTWMYRIALNTALTHIKRNKRKGHSVAIEEVVLQQTELYDTAFEQRIKILYKHIHQLNVLEKGLMLLLLEGKSYSEISEITGLTPSNVGTRLSRIKLKLRSKIEKK
ncbi:RNA polymerase sigma factor [Maribacter polysaccharolyticus]|uniref:RNA polymerase sigma factor n=1 Tax=Maribacter polysaccharolyticus TaxID=3020831 RepID=UPI00237F69E3|nr:sigma-70 family RNA polymerase sigma factor [Maribacter polysaccharolyticus]MDE3740447.1 sigma-70 family RNA polymerase sigma factor [Maribacter polysaccharolyticus]